MDHKYHQLVLFPHITKEDRLQDIPEASHEGVSYEMVTQTQLARIVAGTLLVGFGVFLMGYSVGQVTVGRAYDALIPGELQGVLLVDEPYGSNAEVLRVATLEEAVTLGKKLSGAYEVVKQSSVTASGKQKCWYQVIHVKEGISDDR